MTEESGNGRITKKQRVFVEEYLQCWNAAEAARRAGYSERTARQIGSKLLTNVDISKAIEERIREKAMSADEVLLRLADQARGNMGDFIDPVFMTVDLAGARDKNLLHLIKEVKQRTVTTETKDSTTERHFIEIKLHDSQAALVHLGRHHKLFTDRVEQESTSNININIDF